MDELSHVFSPVAEKELLVNATSLFFFGGGASSNVQCPAFALKRKVRKTEPRGGFIS